MSDNKNLIDLHLEIEEKVKKNPELEMPAKEGAKLVLQKFNEFEKNKPKK